MTTHTLQHEVYRESQNGKPMGYGQPGLIYPDDAAHQGYQIVTVEEARAINVGDMIDVGTGHEAAALDDPRPAISSANYGRGLKLVAKNYRRVTRMGEPYTMFVDEVAEDEERSMSGQATVGQAAVTVQRVYFEKSKEAGWSY